jgi:NarL family two-component system response regulator LiaR
MPNHSIVIIEDEPVMRKALAAWFAGTGRWLVYGAAAGLDDARTLLSGPAKEAGIVLLDIRLKTEWGLDLIPWLKSQTTSAASTPAVAVYSCFSDSAHVSAALSLGVKAYIIKKRDETELEAALETVLAGGTWIDSEAERPPKAPGGPLTALTKREAQILSLIKDGLSFREIARRLGIKPHTVQNTATCIKEKLYIKNFKDLETR